MFEITQKDISLNCAEDVAGFIMQLQKAGNKLSGSHAKFFVNKAEYLKGKKYKTDRNLINILNVEIDMSGKFWSDLITAIPQEVIDMFTIEKPVYQLYYSGLMAQLTAAKFFFQEDWETRKMAFSHASECISFCKLIYDSNRLKFIYFVRSTGNRLLHVDFFGMVHIAVEISEEFKRQNKDEISDVDIAVIISDYQFI